MPQPPYANGPWGEAIRYWLTVRRLRQADLARPVSRGGAGVDPNTISRAARGFDTTTRVLRRIAAALSVTLDDVLVSPQRHHDSEERRRLAIEIAERVLREVEGREPTPGRDPESAIDTLARLALEKERQQQTARPKRRLPRKPRRQKP